MLEGAVAGFLVPEMLHDFGRSHLAFSIEEKLLVARESADTGSVNRAQEGDEVFWTNDFGSFKGLQVQRDLSLKID